MLFDRRDRVTKQLSTPAPFDATITCICDLKAYTVPNVRNYLVSVTYGLPLLRPKGVSEPE